MTQKGKPLAEAHTLTLVTSPQPFSVCIPAPILVVRRLADGSEMARFPAPAHQLARKMARRWRGTVEVIPGQPPQPPPAGARASRRGTPASFQGHLLVRGGTTTRFMSVIDAAAHLWMAFMANSATLDAALVRGDRVG